MWKRLPLHNRGKENQIGSPILIDTTYDEKALDSIPSVFDIQRVNSNHNTRSAFGQRNTDDVLTELPQLPL